MTRAAEDGGVSTFAVVFFDGEREADLGSIEVDAAFEFKEFQSILCNKIGIAPHQISFSLIRKKKSRSAGPRRIAVNEKFNFGSILNETHRDCFFAAVLKRSPSRRDRRAMKHHHQSIDQDEFHFASPPTQPLLQRSPMSISATPPEKVLLRRPEAPALGNISDYGFVNPLLSGHQIGLVDQYESHMRNLQMLRENYLVSSNSYTPYTEIVKRAVSNSRMEADRVGRGSAVCEECARAANGRAAAFHSCVYDAVTVGFRSLAGPIARPSKP